MSLPEFQTHITKIREEALKIGFSIKTIDSYEVIWKKFIEWHNPKDFKYTIKLYDKFLLEYYHFNINSYTTNSKSRHKQLMRSKRILEDFNSYKEFMIKKMFSKNLYNIYPNNWNLIIDKYLNYSKNIKLNSENTIKLKRDYLVKELSYFYKHGLNKLEDFSNKHINQYIIDTVNAGNISKRRNFYILREFLKYLFIEDILNEDLSSFVPKIKCCKRKRIPTYLKQDTIEEILQIIPRETITNKRDYTIILLAARLGLRINDILNIKLKDIDWINYKINVIQPKTNNLNVLPLSKEVGWAIIDYIKVRPKCNNKFLFIKTKYPFEKMEQFNTFNKYFEKVDFEIDEENKKGIHNLRHSLAKNMLDNDIPIHIISSTLGHNSINTTSSTYLKIDIKSLKKCILEVDE